MSEPGRTRVRGLRRVDHQVADRDHATPVPTAALRSWRSQNEDSFWSTASATPCGSPAPLMLIVVEAPLTLTLSRCCAQSGIPKAAFGMTLIGELSLELPRTLPATKLPIGPSSQPNLLRIRCA